VNQQPVHVTNGTGDVVHRAYLNEGRIIGTFCVINPTGPRRPPFEPHVTTEPVTCERCRAAVASAKKAGAL
jgi:hypothetical protein